MCWPPVLGRFGWGSLRRALYDLVTLDLACLSSYFGREWFLVEHIPSNIRKQRFEKRWTDSNLIKFQLPSYVIIVSVWCSERITGGTEMAMRSACCNFENQCSSTWFSPDFNFLHSPEHINSEIIRKCLLVYGYMLFECSYVIPRTF